MFQRLRLFACLSSAVGAASGDLPFSVRKKTLKLKVC